MSPLGRAAGVAGAAAAGAGLALGVAAGAGEFGTRTMTVREVVNVPSQDDPTLGRPSRKRA